MSIEEKQLLALRTWILEAAPHLNANISVRLWNDEIIPLSDNIDNNIILAINSPEVIRRLIFSPKLMTIFELYAEGIIDIEGGTPLEAVRSWDHLSVLHYARDMNKMALVKAFGHFYLKLTTLQSKMALVMRVKFQKR